MTPGFQLDMHQPDTDIGTRVNTPLNQPIEKHRGFGRCYPGYRVSWYPEHGTPNIVVVYSSHWLHSRGYTCVYFLNSINRLHMYIYINIHVADSTLDYNLLLAFLELFLTLLGHVVLTKQTIPPLQRVS